MTVELTALAKPTSLNLSSIASSLSQTGGSRGDKLARFKLTYELGAFMPTGWLLDLSGSMAPYFVGAKVLICKFLTTGNPELMPVVGFYGDNSKVPEQITDINQLETVSDLGGSDCHEDPFRAAQLAMDLIGKVYAPVSTIVGKTVLNLATDELGHVKFAPQNEMADLLGLIDDPIKHQRASGFDLRPFEVGNDPSMGPGDKTLVEFLTKCKHLGVVLNAYTPAYGTAQQEGKGFSTDNIARTLVPFWQAVAWATGGNHYDLQNPNINPHGNGTLIAKTIAENIQRLEDLGKSTAALPAPKEP